MTRAKFQLTFTFDVDGEALSNSRLVPCALNRLLMKLPKIATVAAACAASSLISMPCLQAQSPANTAGIELNISQSEYRLQLREQRLAEHRADLEMLDKRIERRVEKIVDLLSKSKDSKDSNVTITSQKKQTMEGIAEAIERYQVKRNEVLTELARSTDAEERAELKEGLNAIDDRIEHRVDNLIQLNSSFARSTGYESFVKDSQRRRSAKVNQQPQRVAQMGEGVRRQVNEALRASMTRLEEENVGYRRHLASSELSPENRELIETLLEKNEALIDHREDQLLDSMTLETPTKSVGQFEANTIRKAIEEAGADLNESLTRVFWLADRIAEERAVIRSIKLRLEQLNADLEANK